jgi:anti-sigma factor RsiW
MIQTRSTSPGGEPELGDIDERDALFIAYLEGDLSDEQSREFRAELDEDAELRQEFEHFANIVGGVKELPFEFAPPDFVQGVQKRLRTRSRGRFFADSFLYGSRMPYEAIAVVMIIVMAAAWMLMETPKDRNLRDVELQTTPRLEAGE